MFIKCMDDVFARVLVDPSSSLNVMPKYTFAKFFFEEAPMRLNALVVEAFDGSRRTIIGEVDLPMQIGRYIFEIIFQVMYINPVYSCLLERSWIRAIDVVTSTMH